MIIIEIEAIVMLLVIYVILSFIYSSGSSGKSGSGNYGTRVRGHYRKTSSGRTTYVKSYRRRR